MVIYSKLKQFQTYQADKFTAIFMDQFIVNTDLTNNWHQQLANHGYNSIRYWVSDGQNVKTYRALVQLLPVTSADNWNHISQAGWLHRTTWLQSLELLPGQSKEIQGGAGSIQRCHRKLSYLHNGDSYTSKMASLILNQPPGIQQFVT